MSENMDHINGWREWGKYVLRELERNNADHEKMLSEMGIIKQEIAMLKVKAGVWGLIGGAIPVAFAILLGLLK